MMRFEGSQMASEFKATFGFDLDSLTPAQVMWLVKFGKHVRGRCRSNVALKNHLQRSFPSMDFRDVQREWNGRTYTAMAITSKVSLRMEPAFEGMEDAE